MERTEFHCIFCRMYTGFRLLKLSLCLICRDQLYDFAWVTLVQAMVWMLGLISGWLFLIEETAIHLSARF